MQNNPTTKTTNEFYYYYLNIVFSPPYVEQQALDDEFSNINMIIKNTIQDSSIDLDCSLPKYEVCPNIDDIIPMFRKKAEAIEEEKLNDTNLYSIHLNQDLEDSEQPLELLQSIYNIGRDFYDAITDSITQYSSQFNDILVDNSDTSNTEHKIKIYLDFAAINNNEFSELNLWFLVTQSEPSLEDLQSSTEVDCIEDVSLDDEVFNDIASSFCDTIVANFTQYIEEVNEVLLDHNTVMPNIEYDMKIYLELPSYIEDYDAEFYDDYRDVPCAYIA